MPHLPRLWLFASKTNLLSEERKMRFMAGQAKHHLQQREKGGESMLKINTKITGLWPKCFGFTQLYSPGRHPDHKGSVLCLSYDQVWWSQNGWTPWSCALLHQGSEKSRELEELHRNAHHRKLWSHVAHLMTRQIHIHSLPCFVCGQFTVNKIFKLFL